MNALKYFCNSCDKHPNLAALEINNKTYTYYELWKFAADIYNEIIHSKEFDQAIFIGIMAYRSDLFYASVIAILASGKAYVPFNPKMPADRIKSMIELGGIKTLIIGQEFNILLKKLNLNDDIKIITTESNKTIVPKSTTIKHTRNLKMNLQETNKDDPAYLLFTSGTTGMPKGIPISHSNLIAYIDYIRGNYKLSEFDKCSQVFDTTFDLSMHDLFVTWSAGACLCVLNSTDLISPVNFIRKNRITIWFSVPSMISSMARMRLLKPNQFESIRLSFFCGEAFTVDSARKWMELAPYSRVINLYGPTETTISVAEYEVFAENLSGSKNGIISIGKVFNTHSHVIIDESFNILTPGEEGELCISGPQVCAGYLKNAEKTKSQFVRLRNYPDKTWYRTGDLVRENELGFIDFIGRIDFQVKIRGYRIELQEIEDFIKKVTFTEPIVVCSYPFNNPNADYLVAFVPNEVEESENQIIQFCALNLPEYMIPKKVFFIDTFPTNLNGKIDRKELAKIIE